MVKATLCFLCPHEGHAVWLAKMSARGRFAGRFNGYGGKVQVGETPLACVMREVKEESGVQLVADMLTHVGMLYEYDASAILQFVCWVYVAKSEIAPYETEEMGEPVLFPISSLPQDFGAPDDRDWAVQMLNPNMWVVVKVRSTKEKEIILLNRNLAARETAG